MVAKVKKEKTVSKKKAEIKPKAKKEKTLHKQASVKKAVKPAKTKKASTEKVSAVKEAKPVKTSGKLTAMKKEEARVSVPAAPVKIVVKPEITPAPKIAPPVHEPPKPKEAVVRPEVVVPPAAVAAPAPALLKEIELALPVTVKDLAIKLQEKPSALIKILMGMRVMAGINQTLEEQVVKTICEKFGFSVKAAPTQEDSLLRVHEEPDKPEFLKPRPPIVTMMGHVDHGKTSLLDAIRKTKVAESEHGGITQHIGAYRVHLEHGDITFLDTPGHEAFTAMRARGASITDIVVLVVAADDGIMPQTKEAIDHAKAAGVSIIVAINKIDKPQAEIDRVKKQLSELELAPEDWGGKTITVPVSAKTGQGIDNLLEMIILESQMLELKASPLRPAKGVVIEAKMSKGKGPVATLLVKNGTLHLNESIVVGNCYGKIRAMFNHLGQSVTEAPPAYPVEILGLDSLPEAGEQFFVIKDEKQAKELVQVRQEKTKELQVKAAKKISLEDLYAQIKEGKIKELKIIIKADVQGSLEAIKDVLNKINTSEIKLAIIHDGVGNINPSDVILAIASNALILGFNVVQDDRAKEMSAKEGVEVKIYNIIYELANEIKLAMEGMLEPKLKKIFLGRAEVRKVFKLSKSGMVAGCFVSKGRIMRSNTVSLVRNGQAIFEGGISNLKRFKDDVREVTEGFECGISLSGYDNLQEGDIIEAYGIEKIARKL